MPTLRDRACAVGSWHPPPQSMGGSLERGAAAVVPGPRYHGEPCPPPWHHEEAAKRGRGRAPPATSSLVLASSMPHTGAPAREAKAGGPEAGREAARTSEARQAVGGGRGGGARERRAHQEEDGRRRPLTGGKTAQRSRGPRAPAHAHAVPGFLPCLSAQGDHTRGRARVATGARRPDASWTPEGD
jgi:hypothetical protein